MDHNVHYEYEYEYLYYLNQYLYFGFVVPDTETDEQCTDTNHRLFNIMPKMYGLRLKWIR